jgi:hypothetical protein
LYLLSANSHLNMVYGSIPFCVLAKEGTTWSRKHNDGLLNYETKNLPHSYFFFLEKYCIIGSLYQGKDINNSWEEIFFLVCPPNSPSVTLDSEHWTAQDDMINAKGKGFCKLYSVFELWVLLPWSRHNSKTSGVS